MFLLIREKWDIYWKLKISKTLQGICIICAMALYATACGPASSEDELNNVKPEIEFVATIIDGSGHISAGIEKKMLVDKECLDEVVYQIKLEEEQHQEEMENEYSNLAIANVDKYVNVRSQANTDSEIVGRMYDGAIAQVQETLECDDGVWLKVISNQTEGYIKAQYFIYGEEAARVLDDYIDRYALVNADRLNIRENPDVDSKRIGYAENGEKLKLSYSPESDEQWIYVDYADGKKGYVSAEYVTVREEFIYAKTIEEVRLEEEAEKAKLARQKEDEKSAPEIVQVASTDAGASSIETQTATAEPSSTGNLRNDIVNYALQYVGHPYVHGGNSLETGTDCSGFTSLVYAAYGVGLSRTPGGQLSSNGRSISLAEAQPGDIICYGKSRCTHVALYIGNGQIVHAANPTKGIVVFNATYDNILGVKNVLD